MPARLGAAQKLCVFTGGCCLRGLGRLENFVCLWFLLPSRPWGGSQVFAAFEPWGGSKTLYFHKFLQSLRPRGGSKTLRFSIGVGCLCGLGRFKNFVFPEFFAAFEAWGGSKTPCFHRFWLPARPGSAQKLCVFISVCCLLGEVFQAIPCK